MSVRPPHVVDLGGVWRAREADAGIVRRFAEPAFDDREWATLTVPGHWRTTPDLAGSDGPVLYRRTFAAAPLAPGRRRFLTLDGVFYFGDAWMDGAYLGATEGYFAPHTFEVTELPSSRSGGGVVAIEVDCPPPRDRTKKRTVTGIFSHWDATDSTWNPGGLWRPVRLHDTGPVRLASVRVMCRDATPTRGRLLVMAGLDAGPRPEVVPLSARLVVAVAGPAGDLLAEARHEVNLAAGTNRIALVVDVDAPPRWWPWRLGDQPCCTVTIAVECAGEPSDGRSLRTAFREVRMRHWRLSVNGEPMFVMGSNHGPTRLALAHATPEELAHDVELARDANLDLLRIHAHVTRDELYDAADSAGLMLWQDFPLQWGYARATRRPAIRQVPAMVDRLGHHPSIVLWCAHNGPLPVDCSPGRPVRRATRLRVGASMFLPTWNKDVLDRSVARALRRADPSRPVDRHSGVLPGLVSGGTDTHAWFGWYHGHLDGLAGALRAVPRLARFVTEFGAQAVPATAGFMEPDRWPDLEWERLLARRACQKGVFDRRVPPEAFESFASWQEATQRYQAALVQLQVEDLRRLRHAPTGGFCHFCLADGHPAVTWSVLGHDRVPKRAFAALRDACRTVLPMLDPRTGSVHVASEARAPLEGALVTLAVDGAAWRWQGDVPAPGVFFVGRVELPAAADRVSVRLDHPDIGVVESRYDEVLHWLRVAGRPDRRSGARRR